MVLKKCVKCNKNITKKVPGLECSRCDKTVHADPVCSKLSNKQLNTIRNSTGIEWSCDECVRNISRRSSFIIPEDDGDDDDNENFSVNAQAFNSKKLVQDISREIKRTFREEISTLESSLEFLSEQFTTMEQSLKKQDHIIKELETKNYDLQNKNKNLELRVTVLENDLKDIEQKSLSTSLEIASLPEIPSKDIGKVIKNIASYLEVDGEDIQSSQLLPGTKEKPRSLFIRFKTKKTQRQWIDASKKKCLTIGLLMADVDKEIANNRVYIREALTKYYKTLLYNAKTQLLNKSCQYVWCRDGKVCARKSSNSKIHYIRCNKDIDLIHKQYLNKFEKESSTPY